MTSSDPRSRPFFCREWALQRLQHCLEGLGGARAPGILITGGPGAGKSTLSAEILWPSSEAGRSSRLSSRVLAHHFCQANSHASLDPKHFIESLDRQLRHSPLLKGPRGAADTTACKGDLREIFKRLVLWPLAELPPPSQNLLLLVDSVDETCCCCGLDGFGAESSCSIAELLANHHDLLPPWLLLVCTARRQNKAVTRLFTGFRRLCLDDLRKAHTVRDVQQYILCRLDSEEALRQHLTLDTAEMLNQLHIKSNGCFLYLERVLDGVAEGAILIREIRHIPGTLNGLYLWLCQRLFSGRQFCQVRVLLNALLAAPSPLSIAQLHRAVWTKQTRGWSSEDFTKIVESISSLTCPAGGPEPSLVIFHHSFSEWLLDVKYCTQKYLCSVADGHSMLAMSLSTRAPDLSPSEVHQLARHLLLSDLRGLEPSHLALWLLCSGAPVSDCVASDLPLELDVLQLLLLARPSTDGLLVMEDSGALRRTLERGSGSMEMLLDAGGSLNKRDRAGRTLLAAAAYAGNLEAVTLMISRGANLEATDDYGQTALGLAAHRGHLSVVELLLNHGAQVDHTDSQGWTPLRAACWGGHTEVVEALLAAGAQPDISGPDGRTALRAAAWGGHEGPVKALLRAGAAIDHADIEGWTPLMTAAYMGHRAIAGLLLDSGANVNHSDSEGRTALAVACLCVPAGQAYPEMVSLLLERGSDPELEDKEGITPLLIAAYEGKEEVAELLLEAGADPDRAGGDQMTSLLAAALGGHTETVRVLLLWGAAADVMDAEGRSALVLAATAARGEEALRVLLDRGLNENHQDFLGWSALHWAACEGRRGACRVLIDGGAKSGMTDIEGYTPLHLAAQEGHTGCVEFLINRGSNVDQMTGDHMTALCLAALGGHKAAVQLLLRKGADPDVKTAQGKPLLYLLALQRLIDMAEILLEHGADPEGRDPEERTALHASCWQGDREMAHVLLTKGKANCNALDKERRTPLHCTAWRGHISITYLLLENGAFTDTQCSQGATPLCIAAQEGHEELARVLMEEGKASPFHADHYGRTPIKVAAKGGHANVVHLLEKHGVPPYLGVMGKPPVREDMAGGSGGSWSTLSPVSTGSQSLDNSLKSSKGSLLTSSTYHSQATVPADSLTFTQQVQQHSLPRSRSRQAVALTGILSSGQTSISRPTPGSPTSALHRELGSLVLDNISPELRRNGILTNPKYGSPTYSRQQAGESPVPRSDHSRKTQSSGYFSSQGATDRTSYHKTTEPTDRTRGPSPVKPVPVSHISSPKRSPAPLTSYQKPVPVSQILGSPKKSPAPLTSPEKPVPVSQNLSSPKKSPAPLISFKKPVEAFYPLKKALNPLSSSQRCEDPVYPAKKPQDFVYSPRRAADGSPRKPQEAPLSPHRTEEQTPSSPSSPVISINTMDPQLHLKQAIKLQFEGRTCSFNYRKETPL